eukprot:m.318848 g.318848  ORF g.318848 m.318848 type:complete len:51 (-) comp58425_c0_seq1:1-153(-)
MCRWEAAQRKWIWNTLPCCFHQHRSDPALQEGDRGQTNGSNASPQSAPAL